MSEKKMAAERSNAQQPKAKTRKDSAARKLADEAARVNHLVAVQRAEAAERRLRIALTQILTVAAREGGKRNHGDWHYGLASIEKTAATALEVAHG